LASGPGAKGGLVVDTDDAGRLGDDFNQDAIPCPIGKLKPNEGPAA